MTNLASWFIENHIQILVATFMVAMFLYGYEKGFLKMSVKLVSMILSVFITKKAIPDIKIWILNHSTIYDFIQGRVHAIVFDDINSKSESFLESQNRTQGMGNEMIHNSANLFYKMTGLNKLTEYLADKVSNIIVSVLLFVIIYIMIRILLKFLFWLLEFVVQLPGLSMINRISGGALGLIQSICYIWIMLMIISILPETKLTADIGMAFDQQNTYLYVLKEANIFRRIIMEIVM